jgi:hypothetical protein
MYTFNRGYSGSMLKNVWLSRQHEWAILLAAFALLPVLLIVLMHLMGSWRRRVMPFYVFGAFGMGTVIAVAAPGQWYSHYYQLWAPLLAVSVGWTAGLLGRLPSRRRGWLAHAAIGVALLPLFIVEAETFRWTLTHHDAPHYPPQRDAYALAPRLASWLGPEETFYAYEGGAWLYFISQKQPPTTHFCDWPLRVGPLAGQFGAQTISQLEKTQPAFAVVQRDTFDRMRNSASDLTDLEKYIFARYQPSGREEGLFLVLSRNDRALSQ